MSRTPPSVVAGIPEQGEHTDEVLRETGYSADDIARLRASKII